MEVQSKSPGESRSEPVVAGLAPPNELETDEVPALPYQEHAVIRDFLGAAQDFAPPGVDMFRVVAGIRVPC